jgi:tetratricopeptide (TPR) repeat protein
LRLPFWRRPTVGASDQLRAGRAVEAEVARFVAFEERRAPLQRAVGHYLSAVAAAEPGSELWREAAFAAGSLLAGENSVRDPARAIPLLEAVVSSSRGYDPAYYYLGEAYAMARRFDDAERVWRRGLALDPSQVGLADVLRHLGIDRLHDAAGRGDHVAAVAAAERIPERERVAEAWLLLGDARAALGQPDRAAEAWRRAMALEPLKGMRRRFAAIGRPYSGDGFD